MRSPRRKTSAPLASPEEIAPASNPQCWLDNVLFLSECFLQLENFPSRSPASVHPSPEGNLQPARRRNEMQFGKKRSGPHHWPRSRPLRVLRLPCLSACSRRRCPVERAAKPLDTIARYRTTIRLSHSSSPNASAFPPLRLEKIRESTYATQRLSPSSRPAPPARSRPKATSLLRLLVPRENPLHPKAAISRWAAWPAVRLAGFLRAAFRLANFQTSELNCACPSLFLVELVLPPYAPQSARSQTLAP